MSGHPDDLPDLADDFGPCDRCDGEGRQHGIECHACGGQGSRYYRT